mmetsp:Transcript_80126/g.226832  ORF Transcript_80126/g.226832 Transcript_80126/m.226832 type:complete len:241 (+) Transcript_80126:409-1131(+)
MSYVAGHAPLLRLAGREPRGRGAAASGGPGREARRVGSAPPGHAPRLRPSGEERAGAAHVAVGPPHRQQGSQPEQGQGVPGGGRPHRRVAEEHRQPDSGDREGEECRQGDDRGRGIGRLGVQRGDCPADGGPGGCPGAAAGLGWQRSGGGRRPQRREGGERRAPLVPRRCPRRAGQAPAGTCCPECRPGRRVEVGRARPGHVRAPGDGGGRAVQLHLPEQGPGRPVQDARCGRGRGGAWR